MSIEDKFSNREVKKIIMKYFINEEVRLHNGKECLCYIPYINGIPAMDNGFILKESVITIDGVTIKTDNHDLAVRLVECKIAEIESFMLKNSRFISEIMLRDYEEEIN